MTSIEIAELVGKRHDNVKRTIETLAKNGVIRLPQIEVSERINNLGFNVQYEHYVFEGEQGNQLATIAPTLGQQWLSGQMNNYQNLANVGLGALQGQANAGQTYANNMSQISQQSAALAAANANRPSAMQSAIGGGASGAIAGAGLAKLIGSSTPWGAAIGGGLGLLGSLF